MEIDMEAPDMVPTESQLVRVMEESVEMAALRDAAATDAEAEELARAVSISQRDTPSDATRLAIQISAQDAEREALQHGTQASLEAIGMDIGVSPRAERARRHGMTGAGAATQGAPEEAATSREAAQHDNAASQSQMEQAIADSMETSALHAAAATDEEAVEMARAISASQEETPDEMTRLAVQLSVESAETELNESVVHMDDRESLMRPAEEAGADIEGVPLDAAGGVSEAHPRGGAPANAVMTSDSFRHACALLVGFSATWAAPAALVVRERRSGLYMVPGGLIDATDSSAAAAALRELAEEAYGLDGEAAIDAATAWLTQVRGTQALSGPYGVSKLHAAYMLDSTAVGGIDAAAAAFAQSRECDAVALVDLRSTSGNGRTVTTVDGTDIGLREKLGYARTQAARRLLHAGEVAAENPLSGGHRETSARPLESERIHAWRAPSVTPRVTEASPPQEGGLRITPLAAPAPSPPTEQTPQEAVATQADETPTAPEAPAALAPSAAQARQQPPHPPAEELAQCDAASRDKGTQEACITSKAAEETPTREAPGRATADVPLLGEPPRYAREVTLPVSEDFIWPRFAFIAFYEHSGEEREANAQVLRLPTCSVADRRTILEPSGEAWHFIGTVQEFVGTYPHSIPRQSNHVTCGAANWASWRTWPEKILDGSMRRAADEFLWINCIGDRSIGEQPPSAHQHSIGPPTFTINGNQFGAPDKTYCKWTRNLPAGWSM